MGLTAALPAAALAKPQSASRPAPAAPEPLPPPATGSIPVAFLLSDNAVVIDFAGPWEVFCNVSIPGKDDPAFQLYTVAATRDPIKATGGMTIIPDYTFETAPAPKVIVIPAQSRPTEAVLAWVRQAARTADLTMSVCTGAFLLAKTGLLSGKAATTHHASYKEFAMKFPDISLRRGARYVEAGKVASAGGLTSGIDLTLRVVERYFGRTVAGNTAYTLEYQGQGWLDPDSNQVYARRSELTGRRPICPVCEMEVARATAPSMTYRGKTYYFCMDAHKTMFAAKPAGYLV
jgi:transcriptional regulator GlxA family with amidase domain/YHS domain-containing protein